MKHLFIILGLLASVAMPLAAKADPVVAGKSERPPKWLVRTEVVGKGENQATYYYTNVTLAGSHTPVVLRRYKGRLEIVSGTSIQGKSYAAGDGPNHGGGSIAGLDPGITH